MTDIAGIDVARIEIRLPEASLRTKAGSTLEKPVTLVNLTPLPDFFYLAISGIPAPWASFDKQSANLFPNWSDNINLTVAVPVDVRPGSYNLIITASARAQENVSASIKLELIVEGETTGPAVPPVHGMMTVPKNTNGGAPVFPVEQPGPISPDFQPAGAPPAPDFPRLQLDLESGEVVIPCGQTAEQVAHLLNLGANPQNFNVKLEGLPPEWITVQPPLLHLSPNWSETAHLKIAVPGDGMPGRYLIAVIATPEYQPEAATWRQFDIVILPPGFPASPVGPGMPASAAPNLANHPITPATPLAESIPVSPQPAWNPPFTPAAPAPETPQAEPRQRSRLFGWKKKKVEPVQHEPILFVPIAPAQQPSPAAIQSAALAAAPVQPTIEPAASLTTVELPAVLENRPDSQVSQDQPLPVINPAPSMLEAEHLQPADNQPVVAESIILPPATTETVLVPLPANVGQPENQAVPVIVAVEQPVETAENTDAPEINSLIDEVPTKAPSKFWWDTPAPTATENFETGVAGEENPAITGVEPTAQATQPPAVTAESSPEEGLTLEPAVFRNENLELSVENVKIRFELGASNEQLISLVNLLSNPAFFDLKIEGLPETWYGFSYSQINLFPNWREQVYLRLEAPTDTTPGAYPATLVVTLANLPEDKVQVPLDIEVLPSAVLADKLYRATGAGQPVKLSPDARVELVVSTANLTLRPEENLEQIVSITNYSPIPDLFELKLEGLMDSWYQFSAPNINLFPNWKEEFYLRVNLPQNAVPGLYPVRLMVKGRNYSELHTEQSLLLQVLPPVPKPVEVEDPAVATGPAFNPVLDDVDTVHPNLTGTASVEQTRVTEPEAPVEEIDSAPAQPFSFASFFQQQNLVPGVVSHNPAPAPTLPVVPDAPEATYNQPTSAIAVPGAGPLLNNAPASGNTAEPGNVFEKRPAVKLGQQSALAPQTSLAGIIPVITAQPEMLAPAPLPLSEEEPAMAVAGLPKRTFWQRITGKGKEKPAPVTARIDENVLWRQTPAQGQAQPAAYTSEQPASQGTPVSRQSTSANQPTSAAPIGGASQPAQAGQRSYSPMSIGGEVARVQITLEKPHMTIVAGNNATQQIFLMNLTSLPDNFELNIEGLPSNWFSFENSMVNLFPNWNEHTALTLNISDKVKPDLYKGRIVVTATAQTGVRAIMPIEIQVLAPLVVQARLQPHRGKGYKANYEMLLRNRSMSEGLMTMQWAPSNEFSVGSFNPPTVVLAPGQSQHVKVQVMLRKKTPSDQARQAQPFKVLVQPQWTVAQTPVVTAPVSVEGEYIYRSRWVFIQRHPVLFAFLTIILVIVLLWSLLLLPFIQNTLMALSLDKVTFSGVATKPLTANQLDFNVSLKNANPLGALVPADVSFVEAPDKNPKGVITIRMQAFVFTATMTGTLQVDPVSGNLEFVADKKSQVGSFPWFFIPPDKVTEKLSAKLKTWLKEQNPAQRLDDVYIEGNTVFLKLRNCQPGEIACK